LIVTEAGISDLDSTKNHSLAIHHLTEYVSEFEAIIKEQAKIFLDFKLRVLKSKRVFEERK
jgi:hypothetical protein